MQLPGVSQSSAPEAKVGVLVVLDCPEDRYLRQAVMSVRQQTLDKWTLVVVAGHSTPGLGELREWADHDPRIIPVPVADGTSVAAALNAGMDRLDAPYLALLDQHDFLEPDALAAALRAAGENPDAEIIYTDCDLVDHDGESIEEFPKPDWSPERLRAHPYVAHLALLRVDAIRRAGGWRTDFDGVHDHDLLLRVSEQGAPSCTLPASSTTAVQSAVGRTSPRTQPSVGDGRYRSTLIDWGSAEGRERVNHHGFGPDRSKSARGHSGEHRHAHPRRAPFTGASGSLESSGR